MDYSAKSEAIRLRYYDKAQEQIIGKAGPVQLLMERSLSSACMVLDAIEEVPLPNLTLGLLGFSHDIQPADIARLYNEQLGFAKSKPEEFSLSLHSFFDKLTDKIRKQHKFVEIADFIGAAMRMHVRKRLAIPPQVANAYVNLALQTLEYLRPNKYDMESCIYGVDTNGNPLASPYPYAFSDVPGIKIQRRAAQNTCDLDKDDYLSLVQEVYAQYGITVRSPYDFERLERIQRTHINTVAALLPFINETTWDMAPLVPFEADFVPLVKLTHTHLDLSVLPRILRCERLLPLGEKRTFRFEDPLGELQSLSMRATIYKENPYILYALEIQGGYFYGYYDICDCFLYSVLREANSPLPIQNFATLFLVLYSSLVLPGITLPSLNSIFKQGGKPLHIQAPTIETQERSFHPAS
mgnify:CR=1 FL=1|jgi:hypothetical protein